MRIRTASIDDLDRVAQIEAECFPAAEAAGRESFRDRLLAYPEHFWLLEDEGEIVGFVNGMATDESDLRDEMYEEASLHDPDGEWQMVFGLDTIPSRRNKGCASTLMRHLIAEAEKEGRKGVVLTCKDALAPFYAKFGFRDEGVSSSVHGNVAWRQMRLTF